MEKEIVCGSWESLWLPEFMLSLVYSPPSFQRVDGKPPILGMNRREGAGKGSIFLVDRERVNCLVLLQLWIIHDIK